MGSLNNGVNRRNGDGKGDVVCHLLFRPENQNVLISECVCVCMCLVTKLSRRLTGAHTYMSMCASVIGIDISLHSPSRYTVKKFTNAPRRRCREFMRLQLERVIIIRCKNTHRFMRSYFMHRLRGATLYKVKTILSH